MELTAPILGKHLHLPPLQIIMAVVLLTLVMPKIYEFAFIIFLVQNISAKIMRKNKKSIFSKNTFNIFFYFFQRGVHLRESIIFFK